MYPYIAIEGNIGAGKSQLAKILAQYMNREIILEEFADKAYLDRFYQDRERYGFPLEISFLVERYQQLHHHFGTANLFKQGFISDYFFDKSLIFARQNLNEDQYHLFKQLFDIFTLQIKQPDLLLYIHRPVSQVQKQIQQRERSFELGIPEDYLKSIEEGYWQYFKTLQQYPVLVINLGKTDFIGNETIQQTIKEMLQQEYPNGLTIKNLEDLG